MPTCLSLDEFFAGRETARRIFDALVPSIHRLGPAGTRVSRSQVAFRRRRGFAWAWTPDRYLRGSTAPLVLSLALRRRDASPRWKEIVEPAPGRFMHHLELRCVEDIDAEVLAWLREAWDAAG
jgi:hypothetical protein